MPAIWTDDNSLSGALSSLGDAFSPMHGAQLQALAATIAQRNWELEKAYETWRRGEAAAAAGIKLTNERAPAISAGPDVPPTSTPPATTAPTVTTPAPTTSSAQVPPATTPTLNPPDGNIGGGGSASGATGVPGQAAPGTTTGTATPAAAGTPVQTGPNFMPPGTSSSVPGKTAAGTINADTSRAQVAALIRWAAAAGQLDKILPLIGQGMAINDPRVLNDPNMLPAIHLMLTGQLAKPGEYDTGPFRDPALMKSTLAAWENAFAGGLDPKTLSPAQLQTLSTLEYMVQPPETKPAGEGLPATTQQQAALFPRIRAAVTPFRLQTPGAGGSAGAPTGTGVPGQGQPPSREPLPQPGQGMGVVATPGGPGTVSDVNSAEFSENQRFRKSPEYTTLTQMQQAGADIKTAIQAKSLAGDQAAITGLEQAMKIVQGKGGDITVNQIQASNVLQKAASWLRNGQLTDAQRQQVAKVFDQLAAEQYQTVRSAVENLRPFHERMGINTDRAIPPSMYLTSPTPLAAPTGPQAPRPTAQQPAQAPSEVVQFGGKAYRKIDGQWVEVR